MSAIRVQLPYHLRTLAKVEGDIVVNVEDGATIRSLLEAIETAYPPLSGTIREHVTGKRRPWVRFFACKEDISFAPHDSPLPTAVTSGDEPFIVVGAIAGG
jgi:sulfur-carrier protein